MMVSDCDELADQPVYLGKGGASVKSSSPFENTSYLTELCDLHHLIKVALKRPSRKKKLSNNVLAKSLEKISLLSMSHAQRILLSWLQFKLNTTCGNKTISNYHSLLTRRWLYTFDTQDITKLPIDELVNMYRSMIEPEPSKKNQDSIIARLNDIHGYCVREFNFPPLFGSISEKGNEKMHVRAAFIDEALFNALLVHIDNNKDLTHEDKSTLKCIAIISYRCGLRSGEINKLTLDDIEKSEIGWMQVRTNKIDNNKSQSSLRKVPLYSLLLEDEANLLRAVISQKRSISKSGKNPAFTLGVDPNVPYKKDYVSKFISFALRSLSQLNVFVFVFHHLRHSCLSRLQLMCEVPESNKLFPNIVPYSVAQFQSILHLCLGYSQHHKYYHFADFDGHSSPKTCFSNYFHFTDWIVAYKLSHSNMAITKKENKAFNLLKPGRFNALFKNEEQGIYLHECLPDMIKRAGIKAPPLTMCKPIAFNLNKAKKENIKRTSLMLSYDILKKYEADFEIEFLAAEFNIKAEIIKQWVENAKWIFEQHTTQRMSPSPRHSQATSLLPGKPKSSSELALLDKLINQMRIEYPLNPEAFKNMLEHALKHQCINQSGITFQWPEDLEGFLKTFKNIIPKSHLRIITYTMEQGALTDEWETACKNITTKIGKKAKPSGAIGKGYVRLEVKHPNEKIIIPKELNL